MNKIKFSKISLLIFGIFDIFDNNYKLTATIIIRHNSVLCFYNDWSMNFTSVITKKQTFSSKIVSNSYYYFLALG